MDLFERIQNIKNINYEKELQNTIIMVKEELKNIIIKRRCKIYNGHLFRKLIQKHMIVHLINTLDLGLTYEHVFLLVPMTLKDGYYLVDLTYEQFNNKDEVTFKGLLQNGYQKINDLEFNAYLRNIESNDKIFLLEDVFYLANSEVQQKR